MKYSKPMSQKILAMASAALLCGSMGWAQASAGAPGAAGQAPGSANTTPMDAQMNGPSNGMVNGGQASPADKMFVRKGIAGWNG